MSLRLEGEFTKKPTGDLQFVQQMNRKLVLETLLNHAPVARVEIARITTLSPTTVTSAISDLIKEGLVREIGTNQSGLVGRRPILLDICWDSRFVIGLSVLDNRLVGVRTNLRAERKAVFTCDLGKESDILTQAKLAVTELLSGQNREDILGIGISTPGILDRAIGGIEKSTNYPWARLSLGQELSDFAGVPTLIENDTNLAALGEQYFGHGRGANSFAYVHVGTGVGSGIIMNENILLGNRGNAGEIGHMTVDWKGKKCACGALGCLETYVNWRAVAERLEELQLPNFRSDVLELLTSRPQFLAEVSTHSRALPIFTEIAKILAAGIASLVVITDPELVIVEGIYRQCNAFMEELRTELGRRLENVSVNLPEITLGKLGEDAAVLGAVALVLDHYGFHRSHQVVKKELVSEDPYNCTHEETHVF